MAPLQGHTLGQRQKYYNNLVKEAIANKPENLPKINYHDDDVDNMIKIDIACSDRNVEYILDIFKCDDMMYVSRAMKKSKWLITDQQYAHIINPEYLQRELFPQLNAKAVTKLMLQIRLHLKDESRLQNFFEYVEQNNPKASLRWLQNCSVEFIQSIVNKRAGEIPLKLLKRLIKRSIEIIRTYTSSLPYERYYKHVPYHTLILLKSNTIEYLNFLNKMRDVYFNVNYTSFLMRKYSELVMCNLSRYFRLLDTKTFVKFIKKDEIESFLIKNWNLVTYNDDKFKYLTPFLEKMSRDRVLPMLRVVLNVKDYVDRDTFKGSDVRKLIEVLERQTHHTLIYRWYQFIPFDIAFPEIVKFIFAESSPEERNTLLIILLSCANSDLKYVKIVLQYYCEKHVNEIYMHKIKFIKSLLAQYDVFKFDDCTWNLVNTLFQSLEVYIECDNNVQSCLIAIIIYKVLNNQDVPEIVVEKFEFETLKEIRNKLNIDEQEKVFKYMYNMCISKLLSQNTESESGLHDAIEILKNTWMLIVDWQREQTHNAILIKTIGELGNINKTSSWYTPIRQVRKRRNIQKCNRRRNYWRKKRTTENIPKPYINFPLVYKMIKSYRKNLFEQSIVLYPSEEVCINALKHDPGLLKRHKNEVDALRRDEDISLKRFLRKLRAFWSDSLAAEWADIYMQDIQNLTCHRSLVRGLIILLPQTKLIDYVRINCPEENKIQWNEDNETKLSLRKQIAKHLHLARPQLPADVVLWYAKGDYLQYALLSLNTIYYNLRTNDIPKYIDILLKAPVSLRKHGIRLAFTKFDFDEIVNRLPIIWKSSRNATIRAIIFTKTYGLLCKTIEPVSIIKIWSILSTFIDNLNQNEDKMIYTTLSKMKRVPLSVIGDYYQKTYTFLKSLPLRVDLENNLDIVIKYATKCMEFLDCKFVETSLLGPVYDLLLDSNEVFMDILSSYLLCSKDQNSQMQKYEKLLHPIIVQCEPKWANNEEQNIKHSCQKLFDSICQGVPYFVFEKNMAVPINLLHVIHTILTEPSNKKHDNYKIGACRRLSVAYVNLLNTITKDNVEKNSYNEICCESRQEISKLCIQQFTEDVVDYFPSIYLIYDDVIKKVFIDFDIMCYKMTAVLNEMLSSCENSVIYLLVLKILSDVPHYDYSNCSCREQFTKSLIQSHSSKEVSMHYYHQFGA